MFRTDKADGKQGVAAMRNGWLLAAACLWAAGGASPVQNASPNWTEQRPGTCASAARIRRRRRAIAQSRPMPASRRT
jgi:hypothetical protein